MGFTPSAGLNMGFTPSVVCLKGFTPNKECRVFVLRCRATSFLDLPNLVSTVLPLNYPMSFIHVHSCMHMQHAYEYHSCMVALSVLLLIVQKSVIRNVSKSEMLPVMYISSGRSHQNSRLPMSLHFPGVFSSVVITLLR